MSREKIPMSEVCVYILKTQNKMDLLVLVEATIGA